MTTPQQDAAVRERERRNDFQRVLEVRGIVGRHRAPSRDVRFRSLDGVPLVGTYLPGPSQKSPVVVLAHGFLARRTKPAYAFLADLLAGFAHVLSVDLRGHGDSGGQSAFGRDEWRDVIAAADLVRRNLPGPVVPIGLSMGGTAVVQALARGLEVQGAVVVSSGDRITEAQTDGMAEIADVWHTWWKRHGVRLLAGVRLVHPNGWEPFTDPVELLGDLDLPVLIVHGEDDPYFPLSAAEALHESAGDRSVLWREPDGFGHAEDGVTPAFGVALGKAIEALVATGSFPERDEVRPD